MSDITRREFIEVSSKGLALGALAASGAMSFAQAMAGEKTVLITGTSSGFGYRMALTFARAGFRTYASMRAVEGRNAPKARQLLDVARAENLKLQVIELDVTVTEQAQRVVDTVIAEAGRLDVLINNAGIFAYTPIEVVPRQLWELQMKTNVFGPMELSGLVLPQMRVQGSGLVIQVSSRLGRVLIPGVSLYSSSKFAMEAATEALHYESTPQGIDFAIIQPSAFDTDVNKNARKIYNEFSKPLIESQRPRGYEFHRQFLEQLDRNFSGQPTRNPQEVADAALAIAQMPREERVLRYPVGDAFELDPVRELNKHLTEFQGKELQSSGYGHLFRD